jgi:hypothetical protein
VNGAALLLGDTFGTAGFRLTYDAVLVEETVLLAERRLERADRVHFRVERDRVYEAAAGDEREARFEELHGRWFLRLGLDRPLHEALSAQPALMRRTGGCRVGPARSARDEMADLQVEGLEPGSSAMILIRLRPQSFLAPDRLAGLLRHELEHVADMTDPEFGYQRDLPPSDAGPSYDNLLRDRYRAVWDATVDGRLFHRGLLGEAAREARRAEFARAFPMLEPRTEEHFRRWFDEPRPTHAAIVAFALHPPGPAGGGGRCPLCGFPTPKLDPHPERIPAPALREMERTHPAWRPEQGLCAQCADLLIAGASRG